MNKDLQLRLSIGEKLTLFLRGNYTILGIAFTCIGLLFSVLMLRKMDPMNVVKLHIQSTVVGDASVDAIEFTGLSINDRPMLEYSYHYTVGEEDYQWQSYDYEREIQQGQNVKILYNPSSPEYSMIQGMQDSPSGYMGLFVLIFPAVGIGFLSFTIVKGLKFLQALQNGVVTNANLIANKIVAHGDEGSRDVHKLTFEYQSSGSVKHQLTVRTQKGEELMDEDQELLVYNSSQPEKAILVDDLPKRIARKIKNTVL